ncbi:protein of RNA polymerase I-specific transcription initiation factor RRN6-like family [Pseudohyphozyma bogoriensis]|nr:protein of RNA polymerase I-specific transcription initiation factor RRN6-like family [Pseudohyphozyma bogoriensis]
MAPSPAPPGNKGKGKEKEPAAVRAPGKRRCFNCYEAKRPCNGGYPCSKCSAAGTTCGYPQRNFPTSEWDVDPERVQRFPEPLRLERGSTASARLRVNTEQDGAVLDLAWEEAVLQDQGVRLKQSKRYSPTRLFPATFPKRCQEDVCELDRQALDGVNDGELLDNALHDFPHSLFYPTILLDTLTSDRAKPARARNVNFGNCLAVVNYANDKGVGSSHAVWRRPDGTGRPSGVGFGGFGGNAARQAVDRKGKGKARNQDLSDVEEEEENGYSSDRTVRGSSSLRFPVFTPSASTLLTRPSAIHQLQLAPLASSTLLSVLTSTSLSLIHTSFSNSSPILSTFEYNGRNLGRKPIADVVLGGINGGDPGAGMIVDTAGNLYGWGLGLRGSGRVGDEDWDKGRMEMFRLRRGKSEEGGSGFARVRYGGTRGMDAVVAKEKEVVLFDLRSPKATSTLLDSTVLSSASSGHTSSPHSIITSLSVASPHSPLLSSLPPTFTPTSIHVVSTTKEVIWVDERMPGKDLMSWSHGRVGKNGKGEDWTLALMEVPRMAAESSHGASVDSVILHSRIQPQLEVYSHSSHPLEAPRSLLDPYLLSPPTQDFRRTGLSVVSVSEKEWMVMETGADGAVWSRMVGTGEEQVEDMEKEDFVGEKVRWMEQVQALAEESEKLEWNELGNERSKENMKEIKITKAFKDVFGDVPRVEEVEEVKKAMASQIERVDVSMKEGSGGEQKGTLTLFDLLAFPADLDGVSDSDSDSNDPPKIPVPSLPRSTTFLSRPSSRPFTTGNSLGAVAPNLQSAAIDLRDHTRWSTTLFSADNRGSEHLRSILSADAPTTWEKVVENKRALAKQYAIEDDDEAGQAACEQVVLDTTLASQLYSFRAHEAGPGTGFGNAPFPPDMDPPKLRFSSFDPAGQNEDGDGDDDDENKSSLNSMGARLLLSEWNIGSNPRTYRWNNPYLGEKIKADDHAFVDGRDKKRQRKDNPPSIQPSTPSFSIPQIIHTFADSGAEESDREFGFSATQPQPFRPFGMGSSQVSLSPNGGFGGGSQPLPGPFGGRGFGSAKEKEKKKKRVSGF